MTDIKENEELSYVLQLTDYPDRFKCALKIDPGQFSSFEELLDRYVKVIDEGGMTPESARNLGVIQDCIYKIDDDGELLDLYEGLIIRQDDDVVDRLHHIIPGHIQAGLHRDRNFCALLDSNKETLGFRHGGACGGVLI